jgi:hypothetical protein
MHNRRLVGHFFSQFIENDWSPDVDGHQMLALVAAGVITIPLFATVLMGVRYLIQPLQSVGWSLTAGLEDQIVFCAMSMLVAAIVATIQWEALALSPRDAMILGVLPIERHEIVRAKVIALVLFVGAFVAAVNTLPTVIHPAVMVATLPTTVLVIPLLMLAHGLATTMAAAFGFACVVGLREVLQLSMAPLGQRTFIRMSKAVRSAVLLTLLVFVVLTPARLAGRADWLFPSEHPPVLLRPVGWFAATHAAIAGRVLHHVPQKDLPPALAIDEHRLRRRFERSMPHFTMLAVQGALGLFTVIAFSLAMYLWNARRVHALMEERRTLPTFGVSRLFDAAARALVWRPATRAGVLFLVRTLLGSQIHHLYLLVSLAAGLALLVAIAPGSAAETPGALRTLHIAAQALILTALITGYRAAIRTAADERAAWLFGITDTGHFRQFRNGVRIGAIAGAAIIVLVLLPLHARAWGAWIASAHAINGLAVGWLIVEAVSASVERPLVTTIPSNDGLNTVGAVFLGATVIGVVALARVELVALRGLLGSVVFPLLIALAALCLRHIGEQQHRATALAIALSQTSSEEYSASQA